MTAPPDAGAVRRADAAMLTLLLLTAAVNICCAEKIFIRGGLGWDGEFYGNLAKRFGDAVFGREVDAYRLQRILPSGIVHYALRALGRPLDNPHIIRAFEIYNAVVLLAAGLLWTRIAGVLRLSLRGRWLGFAGLFVNYAILKQAFYYPVSTDVSALALGLLFYWLYLTDRRGWLLSAGIAGAFIWPLASLGAAALLLFPRGGPPLVPARPSTFPTVAAAALTAFMIALLAYLYYVKDRRAAGFGPIVPIVEPVFYLSVAIFAAYIFVATRMLLEGIDWPYLWSAVRALRPPGIALALGAVLVPRVIMRLLAAPEGEFLSARTFLAYLAILPVTRPGVFLVAHVVYFGPVVLLLAFYWREICRRIRAAGPGLVVFVLVALPITFTSESRQSLMAFPVLVALLASVLEGHRWTAAAAWLLAVMALVLSKFWLPIHAWLPEGRETDLGVPLYFMSQGPWMSNAAYLAQGAVVLVMAMLVWSWVVRHRAPASG